MRIIHEPHGCILNATPDKVHYLWTATDFYPVDADHLEAEMKITYHHDGCSSGYRYSDQRTRSQIVKRKRK